MATLRQYVRHAELYGSYDSVFEEARAISTRWSSVASAWRCGT
jgi:hypothetical protein